MFMSMKPTRRRLLLGVAALAALVCCAEPVGAQNFNFNFNQGGQNFNFGRFRARDEYRPQMPIRRPLPGLVNGRLPEGCFAALGQCGGQNLNQGGQQFNQGGQQFNQGGQQFNFNQGGQQFNFNQGGQQFNQGGQFNFNQGGQFNFNQGGFNFQQGGFNQGGFNFQQGGFNQGGFNFQQGGFNQGGFNFQQGKFQIGGGGMEVLGTRLPEFRNGFGIYGGDAAYLRDLTPAARETPHIRFERPTRWTRASS